MLVNKLFQPGDGHDGGQLQQPDCDRQASKSADTDGSEAGQLLAQLRHVLPFDAQLVHTERDGERGPRGGGGEGRDSRPPWVQLPQP